MYIGIIPARYASTRLMGKPLVEIGGKSMIRRVYEQASKAQILQKVWVATDDERIFQHVQAFGGQVVMTKSTHQSGTERCAEAIQHIALPTDIIINIQGDEPFIHPEQITAVGHIFQQFPATQMATLAKKITDPSILTDPNTPKVVFNQQQNALYFSRHCIPYLRNYPKDAWLQYHDFYKHIGIYAYRKTILQEIVCLPPTPLEQMECLEQLRWLENGYSIRVGLTELESKSVDTPADLTSIRQLLRLGK